MFVYHLIAINHLKYGFSFAEIFSNVKYPQSQRSFISSPLLERFHILTFVREVSYPHLCSRSFISSALLEKFHILTFVREVSYPHLVREVSYPHLCERSFIFSPLLERFHILTFVIEVSYPHLCQRSFISSPLLEKFHIFTFVREVSCPHLCQRGFISSPVLERFHILTCVCFNRIMTQNKLYGDNLLINNGTNKIYRSGGPVQKTIKTFYTNISAKSETQQNQSGF